MTSAYLSRPLRSFAEALLASRCPYPVLPDKTVAACIAADCCGCDNRDALALDQAAAILGKPRGVA